MRHIVSGINSLVEYLEIVAYHPEQLCPEACLYCGMSNLWSHGHYDRKADKENSSANSLNPVPILRFYCNNCKKTCSSLPECIPPNRHYLWKIQQQAITMWLILASYKKASDSVKPSRWTISRWCQRLTHCFAIHADTLRNQVIELGRFPMVTSFWHAVLEKFSLSRAMLLLNNAGINVP